MAGVRFDRVSKRFGDRVVLRDVSFSVPDGELWAVLGPSGSGKSTVLRLVAGLEDVTAGAVSIGGEVMNAVDEGRTTANRPPGERDVAFVFQSYALYPHLTVFDNIAFPLRVARVPRAEVRERVLAAATLLGLTDTLDRRPRELSGGQRQRVAIGRAVVRRPQVFLFDEPLSNLDARLRASTRLEILALHRRLGTTMLYVTHDQEEAMTLGQRIAVVHDGRVQQVGTPQEIYRRPANLFVAGFIGSPRMNVIQGRVDGGRFRSADASVDVAAPDGVAGDVTLGIRPDHVTLADEGGIAVQVEVVEDLGRERHVHVRAGSTPLTIVERGPVAAAAGDTLAVSMDTAHLHWFAKDGVRIGD